MAHIKKSTIILQNKKATFSYAIQQTYLAGMALQGQEVRLIKQGKAGFSDAYCFFKAGRLFLKGLHLLGVETNKQAQKAYPLLLERHELKKLFKQKEQKGYTLIPLHIEVKPPKGLLKLKLALAQGKRLYDKRQAIKARDIKRKISAALKQKGDIV